MSENGTEIRKEMQKECECWWEMLNVLRNDYLQNATPKSQINVKGEI